MGKDVKGWGGCDWNEERISDEFLITFAFALTEFQPQPAQIDLSADCLERVKNELVRNSESLFVGRD